AIAGMLLDVGIADVPPQILAKPLGELSPEERTEYHKHPLHSINLLKKRRLILNDRILAMIEQHHENYDGSGYPKGLAGSEILQEAQLLAIADELDERLS